MLDNLGQGPGLLHFNGLGFRGSGMSKERSWKEGDSSLRGKCAIHLARTRRVPVFMLIFRGLEAKELLTFQGQRGITSVVRCNLRLVTFGVDKRCKIMYFSTTGLKRCGFVAWGLWDENSRFSQCNLRAENVP